MELLVVSVAASNAIIPGELNALASSAEVAVGSWARQVGK